MIRVKINVRGFKSIRNKIQSRINKYGKERRWLFVDPLARTIHNIRKRLRYDSDSKFNHVYTGRMYNETKAKMQKISISETHVYFGYWVPYGQAFERGGRPRWIPLRILKPWSLHRFGSEGPATPIQRNISKAGTRSYPIIQKTWKGNQQNYTNIVLRRFWSIWK